MKFITIKIIFLSFLFYAITTTNKNRKKEESTTLFEMFGNLRNKASKHTKDEMNFLQKNNYSFKEKHRKSKNIFEDPEAAEPAGNTTHYITDLTDNSQFLEDWFTVRSSFFNIQNFPRVSSSSGQASVTQGQDQRVNDNFEISKSEGAKTDRFFWFKLKSGYIYYFSSKTEMNALDAILIKRVEDTNIPEAANNKLPTCLIVYDFQNNKFEICTTTLEMKLKWLCSIQNYLKIEVDDRCAQKKDPIPEPQIVKEIKQVIIIPTASRNCNEGWNYTNKGGDWECTCKDGIMQSPIDLPEKSAAVPSTLSPMFNYERVNVNAEESTIDGLVEGGKKINIRYEKNAIRIFHPNMGKIVAIDGAVFVAEEIIFHTPSEHKINGQQFEMEMQVIHYGRTKGDIANQIVLSILFKNAPGHYNKLLDKIDFFNLPNHIDTSIELQHDFFIPSVFLDTDADDVISMEPFSFYTYEGSLTTPPCTERTTHYVTADPIPLSNTIIQLFKEALIKPDIAGKDEEGNIRAVVIDNSNGENNRDTQDLNGRTVHLFDHILNGCIAYQPPKRSIQKAGHYEKVTRYAQDFVFVNGNAPTGIPGSFVVSEKDAMGKPVKEIPK